MRKTKIICTIGPSSDTVERLSQLMKAGMNVARFNFSHGTHEEQKLKFERVKQAREELGLPVATMLDTSSYLPRRKFWVLHRGRPFPIRI